MRKGRETNEKEGPKGNDSVRKGERRMWKRIAFFCKCIIAFFKTNWSHLTLTLPPSFPLPLSPPHCQ